MKFNISPLLILEINSHNAIYNKTLFNDIIISNLKILEANFHIDYDNIR